MAESVSAPQPPPPPQQQPVPATKDSWPPIAGKDATMIPARLPVDTAPNGAPPDEHRGQDPENQLPPSDYPSSIAGDPPGAPAPGGKADAPVYREKQSKPNKVYIGGLPEHTRQEDLQNCFGKIGNIVAIELKVGYGFVEFDSVEAADESVAKYNEGFFMGNKIRVEISHGGGRTATYNREPGACFRCGQMGHWARECPNNPAPEAQHRRHEPPLIDRIDRGRDYGLPPPPPRDSRYDYPPPREYRRPITPPPPRDYRDYPPGPPMRRDYDEYRRPYERDRYAPPVPPADYRSRYTEPAHRGYGGAPPPSNYGYDRYDRRPSERYAYPPAQGGARQRSPPRYRDDYDRVPPRDYPDYRGRATTPPPPVRYPDYPRGATPPLPDPAYRRRSASPPLSQNGTYNVSSGSKGSFPEQYAPDPSPRPARNYAPPPAHTSARRA